jgi:ATP-dependent exoDNAse (exonuclease V) beta subunit
MSFSVYKSSAGSGKTFTLVKEYLKLILAEPDNFRHILAITFTNKAANEMRERVLKSLKDLSSQKKNEDGSPDKIMAALMSETRSSEQEISSRAKQALKLILHDYSDFSIGTIDSFSHRIIRTFARDFGLQVNFNVELDSDELLTTAVDLLLDKVGQDAPLTDLLVQFLENRMEDEQDWNIERIFTDFARVLFKEEGSLHLEKLNSMSVGDFNLIAKNLREKIRNFENRLQSIAKSAANLIRATGIPHSAFFSGNSGLSRYFEKISEGNLKSIEPGANVRKTIEEKKWTSAKADAAEQEKIHSIKDDLEKYYTQISDEYDKGKNDFYLAQAVYKTIFPMAVLNEIAGLLEGFKKQNNIVHIAEFNRRISGIILNEPVPFIYERLGERYRHFLIDEFQDTSVLQWQNLLPLIENSLSTGYFNLVVGDGKQAIYRWRNGDVDQFVSLPQIPGSKGNDILTAREKVLKDHFREEHLKKNFRSGKVIVEFNNSLFSYLKELLGEDVSQVYSAHEQEAGKGREGGYVKLEFLPKDNKGESFREQQYSRILGILKDLVQDGYSRRDVAILCRFNSDASNIAQYLLENKINVVSSESLLIGSSPEVGFLVGFVRFLHESSNKILCAELLVHLYQNGKVKSDHVHELVSGISRTEEVSRTFFQILKKNGFDLHPGSLGVLPAYDLFEVIIRTFNLNDPVNPYLQFFLDQVLRFGRKNSTGILDFIDWWDKNRSKLSIILPEGLDAVQIMTMHKAKGLQFPVVIVPYGNDRFKMTTDYLWVDLRKGQAGDLPAAMLKAENLLEQTEFRNMLREEKDRTLLDIMNLLYVSLTRPEERLYILSPSPSAKSSAVNTAPAFLSYFLNKLGRWDDEVPVYEFGTPVSHTGETNVNGIPSGNLARLLSNDWHGKVFIRAMAPAYWDMERLQKNISWGNLIHEVLSKINHSGDEKVVLEDYLSSGIINESQHHEIAEKISTLLSDPRIRKYFLPGLDIRTEAEILDKNGDVFRPDRIVVDGNTAVVLDFKTGKPVESQKKQMKRYGALLTELGYAKVETFLLYLEPEPELVEVK